MSRARIAALDLGSNSFHLLVAEPLDDGSMQRLATRKLTLRLAEPVSETGRLGSEARARALAAVDELLDEARLGGAVQMLAVATSAIRDAADGPQLCADIEERHGLRVRVLDGLEEGELSLAGMAGALGVAAHEPVLGLDLGGGSYEVMLRCAGEVCGVSLPFGSARLRRRLTFDPPRFVECAALHGEVLTGLTPFLDEVARRTGGVTPPAAATAGTIRDLGRLGIAVTGGAPPERVRGVAVTREQLERAFARVCSVTTAERRQLPGVSDKRADLLPAGGVVLLATLEALALPGLRLCDWGVREGAVLDALGERHIVDDAHLTGS